MGVRRFEARPHDIPDTVRPRPVLTYIHLINTGSPHGRECGGQRLERFIGEGVLERAVFNALDIKGIPQVSSVCAEVPHARRVSSRGQAQWCSWEKDQAEKRLLHASPHSLSLTRTEPTG